MNNEPAAVDHASPETHIESSSRAMIWTGRVVSTLPTLLLLFSAVMKFTKSEGLNKGFADIGWPVHAAVPLGILELCCTVLYIIPRTAVLGAILLTGYLGGAIATHARLGQPFIIIVIFGVLLWLGLFLRDARIRALIPLRR